MIATDPLSLVFLGCVLFAGAFLVVSLVAGIGHLHVFHVGHPGAVAHVGAVGHVATVAHPGTVGHVAQAGHVGHVPQLDQPAHAISPAHAAAGHATGAAPTDGTAAANLWTSVGDTLLGSLNVFALLTFLFFFGLLGYLLHNATNLADVLTLVVPAIVGAGLALAVGTIVARLFASTAGVLTAEGSRLEGQIGRVSRAIRPGGVGEVIFRGVVGTSQSIGARDADGGSIPPDTEIVIVAVRDGIAEVQTWDAFMRAARAGQAGIGQAGIGQAGTGQAGTGQAGIGQARAGQPTDVAP